MFSRSPAGIAGANLDAQVWFNYLRREYMNRPSVIMLVDEMSNEFNLRYEKEHNALIRNRLEKKEYWELDADKKTFLLKFLGSDSNNRFYWGFPNTSTQHGIFVHNIGIGITDSDSDSGAWCVFQSDKQIKGFVNYSEINDPNRNNLTNSISKWKKSIRVTQGGGLNGLFAKWICYKGE